MNASYAHRSMVTQVSTEGTLDVTNGNWKIDVACSTDNSTGTTTVRSSEVVGPGTFDVPDVDAWVYRAANSSTIRTSLSVYEDVNGEWIRRQFELYSEPIAAWPAPTTTKVGLHFFVTEPGGSASPRPVWLDELNAMPAGIDCARIGPAWYGLQPTAASTWDEAKASHLDSVFTELNSRGISVGLSAGTTPSWAGPDEFGPPGDPADVGQWVDDIITRWSPLVTIDYIDVWNEPDLSLNGTMADVVAMTKAAHDGAAGRIPIALPPLSGVQISFMEEWVAAGLVDGDFEIVDTHPYPLYFVGGTTMNWTNPYTSPTNIERRAWTPFSGINVVLDWLDRHGFTADITVSECGVSTYRTGPVGQRITDRRSAEWHTAMIEHLKRYPEVISMSVHEAANVSGEPQETSWNAAWGLVDPNYNRRAKWQAFADALV